MKDFFIFFIATILTRIVSPWIYSLIGLDYTLFKDDFNLWLMIADLSVFALILIAIYFILRTLMRKIMQDPFWGEKDNNIAN